jgi:hypothetical protein
VDDMTAAVLAIAGGTGAGKTTVTTRLAVALGWTRACYSDVIRDLASGRDLPASRPVLQQIGAELISAGWPAFTTAVLAAASWQPGQPLIADGVRHAGAVDALRQAVAPLPLLTVFLEAPGGVGQARARHRDGTSASGQDEERDLAEAELPAVRATATIVLDTTTLDPAAVTGVILGLLLDR